MNPFLEKLRKLYPADRLYEDDARLAPYVSDGLTVFRQKPLAVVMPLDSAEIVATLKLCHEHEVPFVARGSGTSLCGGSLPIDQGIVISLNRLNRILEIDPDNRSARVQPGVINAHVSVAVAQYGLYFAPDPSSQSVCTIGGNLAFNSGGIHCLKYGMTSNHILGVTVALPDGEVVRLGNDSLENVGPDCVGLFVGSEGLFGIALEIQLRLLPIPESFRTILASYDSLEAAGDAVGVVVASGILPGAMEIMDKLAIEAAEAAVNAGYPRDAEALLIIELDGEATAVEAEFQALSASVEQTQAKEIRIAQDEAERLLIWKGRKSAFSAVGRLSPDYLVQDGVVPRSKLGEALKEISRLGSEAGLRVANVFHAGDGNLHPSILFDERIPGETEKVIEAGGRILELCIEAGGALSGEHGIGLEKQAYMPLVFTEDDMRSMGRLAPAFGATDSFNPGKVFPVESGDGPAFSKTRRAGTRDEV